MAVNRMGAEEVDACKISWTKGVKVKVQLQSVKGGSQTSSRLMLRGESVKGREIKYDSAWQQ